MLQWLADTVNWLFTNVVNVINFVSAIVSNPIGYLRAGFDWAIDQAKRFTEAMIWSFRSLYDYLIDNIRAWIHNVDYLVYQYIPGKIDEVSNLVKSWVNNLYNQIVQVVQPWINNLWEWIHWLEGAINNVPNTVNSLLAPIWNWVNNAIASLQNWVYQIIGGIQLPDLSSLFRDIEALKTWVLGFEGRLLFKVFDSLLDWLSEKLGEALE